MNQQSDLLREGRMYALNALLAYGEGFGLLRSEEITDELMETMRGWLLQFEAVMPVMISMWEMAQKLTGEDIGFVDWAQQMLDKLNGADPD